MRRLAAEMPIFSTTASHYSKGRMGLIKGKVVDERRSLAVGPSQGQLRRGLNSRGLKVSWRSRGRKVGIKRFDGYAHPIGELPPPCSSIPSFSSQRNGRRQLVAYFALLSLRSDDLRKTFPALIPLTLRLGSCQESM